MMSIIVHTINLYLSLSPVAQAASPPGCGTTADNFAGSKTSLPSPRTTPKISVRHSRSLCGV